MSVIKDCTVPWEGWTQAGLPRALPGLEGSCQTTQVHPQGCSEGDILSRAGWSFATHFNKPNQAVWKFSEHQRNKLVKIMGGGFSQKKWEYYSICRKTYKQRKKKKGKKRNSKIAILLQLTCCKYTVPHQLNQLSSCATLNSGNKIIQPKLTLLGWGGFTFLVSGEFWHGPIFT